MDYPELISEKWNLTAMFNCLQAIYLYAPSALAVPMCERMTQIRNEWVIFIEYTHLHLVLYIYGRLF